MLFVTTTKLDFLLKLYRMLKEQRKKRKRCENKTVQSFRGSSSKLQNHALQDCRNIQNQNGYAVQNQNHYSSAGRAILVLHGEPFWFWFCAEHCRTRTFLISGSTEPEPEWFSFWVLDLTANIYKTSHARMDLAKV
ncbi:uncharacterized protein G2W53_027023 [Senna tora]|uniref:Uncharacterized protein n=1 Tax=Senna tora TaxID=362788 RepID=A0A834WI01_9FABA|nr:uncharacterized protein G2W53_027023 [Senna tora]